jgi:hypothetical protein
MNTAQSRAILQHGWRIFLASDTDYLAVLLALTAEVEACCVRKEEQSNHL